MADVDNERMQLVILELEEDGEIHHGAAIDARVRQAFAASDSDLSPAHAGTSRSVFGNRVDWVKARMTQNKLHEVVGNSEGQNCYRITSRGRDALADAKRRLAR